MLGVAQKMCERRGTNRRNVFQRESRIYQNVKKKKKVKKQRLASELHVQENVGLKHKSNSKL